MRFVEDKEIKYRKLVEDVKQSYKDSNNGLMWCDACEEINLWTYWQGRGNLDAPIMLVGQDWGNPEEDNESTRAVMANVRNMRSGMDALYMKDNKSLTDKNLVELFKSIGFDIENKNPNLFFTNFVLGYRVGRISKNYNKAWAKHDSEFFERLINIINPQIILCLGRVTFENVVKTLNGNKPKIKSYNAFISGEDNPINITYGDGKTAYVFALAHCGVLGTMNRNRDKTKETGIKRQIEDWKKVKEKCNMLGIKCE